MNLKPNGLLTYLLKYFTELFMNYDWISNYFDFILMIEVREEAASHRNSLLFLINYVISWNIVKS